MKKSNWIVLQTIGVLALVFLGAFWLFGGSREQAVQTQGSQANVVGYTPFQLYEVSLELKNQYDKVKVPSDGSFSAYVYDKNVADNKLKDPRIPYVEKLTPESDFATTGTLSATNTRILTNTEYKTLIKDDSGKYYATLYNMKVPALPDGTDRYNFGDVYVEKIGNIVGATEEVEASNGVSTSITDGNVVATINLSAATDKPYFTIKFSFENDVADSVVKDLTIRSINDPQNPMDKDAIDSVKVSLDTGDNLGIDSDLTSLIRSGQKVSIGDIEDGDKSVYEMTLRFDKALLESGNVLYIYVDDLGDYLGEDIAGDNGMTPKYIKVVVE